MNMADRIQYLRKAKGISQEELADKVGVSRQAVSKWESEQSAPDLEKVIIMSDFFGVTTDYILKGIEPVEDKEQKSKELTGKVLYIASTAFVFIGLFCAFGGWYEKQTMEVVWGSMIIQAVGVAGYFIGRLQSEEKASFYVNWLNIAGIAFMPISIMTGYISILIFKQGWIAPYPTGIFHTIIFGIVFVIVMAVSFILMRMENRKK
ncbi:MAG: helix-turn-helix domain-containing protein [Lachnospiraceae bacterium]|nr:helix-turn-helix domain-containing protein [Lachnospiraceae bacterium]